MQLQQAVQLVQAKFAAESQGQTDGDAHDAYHNAFDQFPLVMEIAVSAFADLIIQQNYEARKTAAAQGDAGTNGQVGPDSLPPRN
ncbi:MAG: hypothetical protein AAF750_13030 [Planctomycetota bacterium]